MVLWARFESPWILVAGAAAVAGAAVWGTGRRHAVSVAALGAAVLSGFVADSTAYRFGEGWSRHWEQRREAVAQQVRSDFARLTAQGRNAAGRLSAAAASAPSDAALRDSAAAVLGASGATAVVVFEADGRLRAWQGSHRGRLPAWGAQAERRDAAAMVPETGGRASVLLGGSPLFSYLYFVADVPGAAGAAAVAWLVRSRLPGSLSPGRADFFSRMEERTGERIRAARTGARPEPGEFAVEWPGGSLRAVVVEPDEAVRRADTRRPWIAGALALAGLVWLLQSAGAPRRQLLLTVGLLAIAAVTIPLDVVPFARILADPELFSLPGPVPAALGRCLLVATAVSPLVVLASPRVLRRLSGWTHGLVVAAGFPLLLYWLSRGASPELLGGSGAGWIAYQLCLTLALALAVGFFLALRERSEPRDGAGEPGSRRSTDAVSWGLIAAAAAISGALAFGAAMAAREDAAPPAWAAFVWVAPAALLARGLREGRDRLSFLGWSGAVWLAATAALPVAWDQRTEARKAEAERELGLLGILRDPAMDALPAGFAERAVELDRAGVDDVELLYGAWTSDGLGEAIPPVFLTLWSAADIPLRDLRLGPERTRPSVLDRTLPALRSVGTREYRDFNERGVRRLAVVSLSGGRLVTAAVPPRRTVRSSADAVPLLSPALTGGGQEFLALARAPAAGAAGLGAPPSWRRNDEGWLAEAHALYPDGAYSVSYTLSIPRPGVMLARATLLLSLSLAVLSALWLLGAGLLGLRFSVPVDWRGLFTSFRARVTWALFAFFLASSAIFGMLDYRMLQDASDRTAAALAERTVSEAARVDRDLGGGIESLAGRTGADLLEYRDGRLAGGTVPALVDLGLYESWTDPEIHESLETGGRQRASRFAELGSWRYVVAYQRLAGGTVIAAPLPLRTGAAALRMRDVSHLLLFTAVLGPVLSLALALFVGRALTRPMQTLQVASERVGRGNFAVHLPENRGDEFGSVFAAFNRMVQRLGAARRELLRTTRRTEAIVDAAATGVVALDAQGKVTAANPRAGALLSARLEVGQAVPEDSDRFADLEEWLQAYQAGPGPESPKDFNWGGRRIRGHARRIVQEGSPGGVVVNLEDVTDELQSERILAWGEMAQQVAHEVKNPLTPMKLSVQHLMRAWGDKRKDFGRILEENVGAVLREIDRLASIAKNFARLGAPGSAKAAPLELVDAGAVVGEVLNLYRGGEGSIHVADDLSSGLPEAWARPDELKEVLINLLENARAAMPGGGRVRVRAGVVEDPERRLEVVVEDDGCGIAPELLPRVFEPQFSTRSKGTGLGLAIVQRIVDSWGGEVRLTSELDRGTKVVLEMRAAPPAGE